MDNTNKQTSWYKQKVESVFKSFGSSAQGLGDKDVAKAKERYGLNELAVHKGTSPLQIFLNQFKDVLVIVLICAATISLGLSLFEEGKVGTESLLIYGIVIAIAVVGFFNEYRAEKTVASLKKMLAYTAKVRRGGHIIEIDAKELVPGDILLLEEGQKVPADARIIKSDELQVNESSLTGESTPVHKLTDPIKTSAALGDQKNMVFSSTYVTSGTGEAIIIGTGSDTEIGRIAELVEGVEQEETPMQRKLDALGKRLGVIVIALCAVMFVIVLLFDKDITGSTLSRLIFAFTAAVALAVAAIPEGLAFVVRISLALGARRMAKQNALVRKLSAVEALGSTDVICSDKTGTLTKGEMTVRNIWADGAVLELTNESLTSKQGLSDTNGKPVTVSESVHLLMTIGALNNNAHLKEEKIIGDPTEASLLVSANKLGLEYHQVQSEYERVKEFAFSSDRKMMSTIHKDEKSYLVAVKGAPDVVLAHATHILINGKTLPLTEERRAEVLKANSNFAGNALRVLGFAMKEVKTIPKSAKTAEEKLIFLGLQAMIDPPRAEVAEVIRRVQKDAGMRVVMITGDHIDTARAIAEELGIKGDAISGVELDKLTQEEFEQKVESIRVYARVNPEHKIRIVQALKKHGHQVAMTGDGVNDAPAIKAADIGIAMGITGTDVTKEAADLILLDDQFLTIISAIEQGRGIFDNVRKFVKFLLGANIAEVFTILLGIVFFRKLLLTPSQLLFINIVTDGLPAIALGSDPAARTIMKHLPAKFQSAIINTRTWAEIVIFAILMTAALLLLYNNVPPLYAATVVFTGMVVFELARLIDIRTDYAIPWFSNPFLTISILISLAIQIAVVHIPSLSRLFEIQPLQLKYWGIIFAIGVVLVVIMKILNKPMNIFGKEDD